MSKGWDSNMLKKLKSLIGKGLSTSEMGKKLGMSKNAVIGKLNRLGWNSKTSDVVEKKAVEKTVAKKKSVEPKTKKTSVEKPTKTLKPAKTLKTEKTVATKTAVGKKTANKLAEPVVKPKPEIKTASKKTKKDLALHELLIQHALQMANLKPNQCRWPIGDPDSSDFHFCGETVFTGKPYCYEHCRQAYQLTPPKKK